jgi:hypothetical protein
VTDSEISLLVAGIALGWLLCMAFVFWGDGRIERRHAEQAAALLAEARARVEADREADA